MPEYPDMLPCRFCGNKPHFERLVRQTVRGSFRYCYYVECRNDDCAVRPIMSERGAIIEPNCEGNDADREEDTKAAYTVVDRWNTRTNEWS